MRARMSAQHHQIALHVLRIVLAFVIFATVLVGLRIASIIIIAASIMVSLIEYRRYRKLERHSQLLQFESQFESILNAFADKSLILLTSAALYMTEVLPLWAAAIFVLKDVIFILGGFYALMRNRFTIFRPALVSKLTLFLQLIALLAPIVDRLDTILLAAASAMSVVNVVVIILQPEFVRAKNYPTYMQFAFARLLKFADIVTLLGVACALLSIVFALSQRMRLALILLIVCVVFDFLDGRIARWSRSANEFGKQLDSLADTVNFGVAPTIIGLMLMQSNLAIIAFSIFLFCGILRLAKFNVMDAKGSFVGMPITFNGLIIPLAFFLGLPLAYFPYLYLFLGILMIAPVRIRKP